ncbi:Uncharacterized conserved protein, LabA/DUF88 family [Jannaschia seohaensis]|uniref:Uncharacterized LabA/DUF88 family protein n=1 Tax=Jannaschia seohaensis TaxID=475081 RepID=A0A2Y9C7J7_9RHOB|nr:uncharacterized LabA/DUF88 family protein [Jannaschia seohaensis]SSA45833.1 Uncharacterized conserved protein, LabA/DUF88 family [Jannaschia seohaensis]
MAAPALPSPPRLRTGIFIDGDNVSSSYASRLLAGHTERPRVVRVYGSDAALRGWAAHGAFEPILSAAATPSRNATDITLALDALHLTMTEGLGVVVLVSSDGDFTPLARMLRRLGVDVRGMGETKTPKTFQAACTRFEPLSHKPPSSVPAASTDDDAIVAAVRVVLESEWKVLSRLQGGEGLSWLRQGAPGDRAMVEMVQGPFRPVRDRRTRWNHEGAAAALMRLCILVAQQTADPRRDRHHRKAQPDPDDPVDQRRHRPFNYAIPLPDRMGRAVDQLVGEM